MCATGDLLGAGVTVVTSTCPIWLVKTRMQLQTKLGGTHSYTSTWDCIRQTARNEGIRGFYKGLGASYLGM
jgi:solute carrier family 25, member 33/36